MPHMTERPTYLEAKNLDTSGMLEKYLISLRHGNLMTYDSLPREITSTGIERYANWFSENTKGAVSYDELGGYIHLNNKNGTLIFPSRPDIGNRSVSPTFSRKIDKFNPVVSVHSHLGVGCFSQPPGRDMGAFINGHIDSKGSIVKAPVWVLATPKDNFFVLKTNITEEKDDKDLIRISRQSFDIHDFYEFRGSGVATARRLDWQTWHKVYKNAEKTEFNNVSLATLFGAYFGTLAISEECKFGFYHSFKDGKYRRVTKDLLNELITQRYEDALRNSSDNLGLSGVDKQSKT